MSPNKVHQLAETVLATARGRGLRITTAESCTGGLIGGSLTEIPGSSEVYEGGCITYSYESKRDLLGVSWPLLMEKGAVCAEVAEEMAEGALLRMDGRAGLSVSVTGIAGPDGGSPDKPVGLVYFGLGQRSPNGEFVISHERRVFKESGREAIRVKSVERGLQLLLSAMTVASDK